MIFKYFLVLVGQLWKWREVGKILCFLNDVSSSFRSEKEKKKKPLQLKCKHDSEWNLSFNPFYLCFLVVLLEVCCFQSFWQDGFEVDGLSPWNCFLLPRHPNYNLQTSTLSLSPSWFLEPLRKSFKPPCLPSASLGPGYMFLLAGSCSASESLECVQKNTMAISNNVLRILP